jgi:hypothetical protein
LVLAGTEIMELYNVTDGSTILGYLAKESQQGMRKD